MGSLQVATSREPRLRTLVVMVALGLLAVPGIALAHFETGLYTHEGGCPASDPIDPINFVFTDWGTWDRSAHALEFHMDWNNGSGGNQGFADHGSCYDMFTQRSSGCLSCTRSHIRLHPIHFDDVLGWTTVGDAHHEDWVQTCNFGFGGHAVDSNGPSGSGFDQGRDELLVWIDGQPGHSGNYTWWGNTQNFEQCDGDFAGSDGATVQMTTHQTDH